MRIWWLVKTEMKRPPDWSLGLVASWLCAWEHGKQVVLPTKHSVTHSDTLSCSAQSAPSRSVREPIKPADVLSVPFFRRVWHRVSSVLPHRCYVSILIPVLH